LFQNRNCPRSWIRDATELKNVDIMADNTDVNVTENNRQSKDYPQNFNAENRSDDTEVLHSPKAECGAYYTAKYNGMI
ncbi:hypothetical protein cypCar_00009487, partial [Cyprinus carpio]